MKNILLNLSFALGLMACTNTTATTKINHQNPEKEERAVSDFTGIASGGNFNVFVSLGEKENLRLEGDADLLKEIETTVEKGVLRIQYKAKKRYWDWSSSDKKKVNIYITAKTLTNLAVSGSGQMKVEGVVKSPDFKTVVSGSGSLVVAAETVNLQATVSGSGNMNLSGSAQNAELTLSGSGNLSAGNFKTKNANATVSGSGNAGIFVEKSLKATLSGSGNIRYGGNPEVQQTQSGSGRISKL